MGRIGLIIGHSEKSPGALAVAPISDTEYGFNTSLSQILCSALVGEHDVQAFFRDGFTIEETYAHIRDWKPDLTIELHLNSHSDESAFGTETLCTDRGKNLAGIIQQSMCAALKRDLRGGDRGVKILTKPDQRGFTSVSQLSCPSILIEPIFCSNTEECKLMVNSMKEFVSAICVGIEHYLSAN